MSENELWIILRKMSLANGGEFQQEGPYSTDQVKELLLRGIVQTTDYVWKKGAPEWIPIVDVPEFKMSEVQEIVEAPPVKSAEIVEYTAPEVGQESSRVVTRKIKTSSKKKSTFWQDIVIAGGLFVLVGTASYYHRNIYSYVKTFLKGTAPIAETVVKEVPKAAKKEKKTASEREPASAETIVSGNGSNSSVSGAKEATPETAPEVVLATDLAVSEKGQDFTISGPLKVGEKLEFALKGKTGQVLEVPALYLHANVLITKPGEVFIDHRNFQIPEGYYEILVIYDGDKTLKKKISLIVDELKFKSALLKHRKQIAYDQLIEKRNLIKFIAHLETAKLNKKKRPKTSKWQPKELQWVTQDRNYLVYRKEWEKLNNLVSSNRDPASDKASATVLKKLKSDVMQKSSRTLYR